MSVAIADVRRLVRLAADRATEQMTTPLVSPDVDAALFSEHSLGIVPDDWQRDVLLSDARQMLLNCSRQSGKSTTAATLALHTAQAKPDQLILLVSPSLRQSSELFRKITVLVDRMSPRPRLIEDNRLSLILPNHSRIVSLPSSEGTVRGFSAVDLIIEDEASRVDDALFYAVRPMLAVSNGRLILMSTPFGKRGHFYESWENGGGDWERIKVTAYEVPRIPPTFLEEERRTMGPMWFASEYLCEFTETEDSVFRVEDIDRAFATDITPLFGNPSSVEGATYAS